MVAKSEPIKVKSVKCTKCAAPIEIRAPHLAQTVVCGSCGSILDAKDPNLAILQEYQKRLKCLPLIPLGTMGQLKGEKFQCIGFMRRRTTVEGINYDWSEYLLYNPFKGFRFLTEYQGHWISTKLATNTPKPLGFSSGQDSFEFLGSTYKHFQTVTAKVVFVVGEFYWQVKVGETAVCSDYVCPPNLLSREEVEKEITWSIGEYVRGEDVWRAFKLEGEPPAVSGVGAAQPSPLAEEVGPALTWLMIFIGLLCAIQVMFSVASQDRQVFSQSFVYVAGEPEKAKVTDYFEITGRDCNIVVTTAADVDNHWLYNQYTLVDEKTQKALDFGREIEYYHGYDGGESWSEGSKTDEVTISGVPAGRYYLRVEPQSDTPTVNYRVTIRRDVTELWPFILSLFLIVIPACVLKYRQWSFEVERWKESDHPLVTSGEGSDDD